MSPIRGLTDQPSQFVQVGELRKGTARTEEDIEKKRPGRDQPHFRFTSDVPGVAEKFAEAYGEKPDTVKCFLPYPSVDENVEVWREEWAAGGLLHRCDGQKVVVRYEIKDKKYSTWPVGDASAPDCQGGCKQALRMHLVIPDLKMFASVVLLSSSIHDILNITRALGAMLETQKLLGWQTDLRGIPFFLSRRPVEVSTPGKDGRARRKISLCFLDPDPAWVEQRIDQWARFQLTGSTDAALAAAIAAADDEDDDEQLSLPDGRKVNPGTGVIVVEPPPAPAAPPKTEEPAATEAQIGAIYKIARDQLGIPVADLNQRCVKAHGGPPDKLTKKEAGAFIATLQAEAKASKPKPATAANSQSAAAARAQTVGEPVVAAAAESPAKDEPPPSGEELAEWFDKQTPTPPATNGQVDLGLDSRESRTSSPMWPKVLEVRDQLEAAGVGYDLPPDWQTDDLFEDWIGRMRRRLNAARPAATASRR